MGAFMIVALLGVVFLLFLARSVGLSEGVASYPGGWLGPPKVARIAINSPIWPCSTAVRLLSMPTKTFSLFCNLMRNGYENNQPRE